MQQEEITIQSLAGNQQINIDYSDDDIIIIDKIKLLAEPSPTRLKMNFIAICTRGRAQFDMNGQTTTIGENQLLFCPPNVTFSDFMFSHDFEFKALFLTPRILQSFLREKMSVWNEVMYIHKMHVLTMQGEDIQFISHFYDMLRLCIDTRKGNPYRADVIQSIIRGALLGLCGTLRQMVALPDAASADGEAAATTLPPATTAMPPVEGDRERDLGRGLVLFQHFLELLNSSPQRHRSVQSFAAELCITPKYLSAVCKKQSGKTANAWITEHLLEDIRYYLRQTDLSIKEVCNLLGFPNPSFFGKYVREHFDMTPSQLRQQGS